MGALRVYRRDRESNELLDITMLCGAIHLEGAVEAASRKLTMKVLRAGVDYYLGGRADIQRGDAIVLDDGSDDYIFYGLVWRSEATDTEAMKSVTCYDNMKFLMKSGSITQTFTGMTAAQVTQKVCSELGVTCGALPETGIKVSVNARGKSGYEAIMIAWTETHKKDGKVYYPRMVGRRLTVIEKGTELEGKALRYGSQDLPCDLISVTASNDSDSAYTSIWSAPESGAPVMQAMDDDLYRRYGYLVGINENGQSADEKSVKKINDGSHTLSVEAIGDWAVQTGWSIPISSKLTGDQTLYIESDAHDYEGGIHTMTLELSSENSMDEIENQEEASTKKAGGLTGNTDEEKIWNFLRSVGFTAEAAAGAMGNMYAESGCVADIEEQSGGGGYGLCQWTGSRRTDLVDWCQSNGKDYKSLAGQLAFLDYELTSRGQDWLREETDVEQATWDWLTAFEVAGITRWSVRIEAAQGYWDAYHAYDVIPSADGEVYDTTEGAYGLAWPCPTMPGASYSRHGSSGGDTHGAADIVVPEGTPVVALADGVVTTAQYWDGTTWGQGGLMSYGNSVVVDYGEGTNSRFAHLSRIDVEEGQSVAKGQQIGLSGNTGTSSGPHLHLEVCLSGSWVDPAGLW